MEPESSLPYSQAPALTYTVLISPIITAAEALNEFSRNFVKGVFPVTVKNRTTVYMTKVRLCAHGVIVRYIFDGVRNIWNRICGEKCKPHLCVALSV
jgi:hypothetical protein